MGWTSLKNIPEKYQKTFRKKGYTPKQKRAWLKTFNSAYKQYPGEEGKAFATAWSVANKIKESLGPDIWIPFKEWIKSHQ